MIDRAAETAILVKSAPSHAYLRLLEAALGSAFDTIDVNALQSMGALRAVRRLMELKYQRLIVPLEDISSYYSLPIFQVLAALSGARNLYVATPECNLCSFSRISVLPKLAQFFVSSTLNICSAARSHRRVKHLLRAARVAQPQLVGRNVLYINANLWFGLKAGGSVGHVAGVINALLRRGYEV